MKSSRLSSGRSREQFPHRPPFQHDNIVTRTRKTANPPRLGRGDTRGSTEARDHFSSRGRADHRHPFSKRNDAGATPAGSNSSQRIECAARLLSGVSLVRCQGEEPFHNGARPVGRGRCLENSCTSNGVQGSSPWRSATHSPAWCKSSTADSQSANPGALPGAGAISSFAR